MLVRRVNVKKGKRGMVKKMGCKEEDSGTNSNWKRKGEQM
jgi:hypothetical protein